MMALEKIEKKKEKMKTVQHTLVSPFSLKINEFK